MSRARIGISGWRYATWRNVFYPKGLVQKRELEFASRQVSTVEINGSFYSLQRPSSYERWYAETPPGFIFAVKGGRFITHNKKLKDTGGALANFFASGVLALEDKLGPILWQLPPQLAFDAERLETFFASLPRTTIQAAALAKMHDHRLKHGSYVEPRVDQPIRYALEIRHPSYEVPGFLDVLRRWNIALCIADTAGKWPYIEEVTSDLVYVRLHGSKRLYASGYTSAELDAWAEKIERWTKGGRDVVVYFDNDVKCRAPFDAINLAARLGHGTKTTFPRKLHSEAEAVRGVEEVSTTWDRWKQTKRKTA